MLSLQSLEVSRTLATFKELNSNITKTSVQLCPQIVYLQASGYRGSLNMLQYVRIRPDFLNPKSVYPLHEAKRYKL